MKAHAAWDEEEAIRLRLSGKYEESMQLYRKILSNEANNRLNKQNVYHHIRWRDCSTSSPHLKISSLCFTCSKVLLSLGKFRDGLSLLQLALTHSCNSKRLTATTLNNLSCFYGRTKRVKSSIFYLEKALSLEFELMNYSSTDDVFEANIVYNNPADCLLNLCVALSQTGKHEQALCYGYFSLILIQNELMSFLIQQDPNIFPRMVVLIIACHNIAVELEHLKRVDWLNRMRSHWTIISKHIN